MLASLGSTLFLLILVASCKGNVIDKLPLEIKQNCQTSGATFVKHQVRTAIFCTRMYTAATVIDCSVFEECQLATKELNHN